MIDQHETFEWFASWVNHRLGATITFGRGASWRQMLGAFEIASDQPTVNIGQETPDRPMLQVASDSQWGWAVEHLTAIGSNPETLCRLSRVCTDALSLSFTQTISIFLYASGGTLISGFDLNVPHVRYGSDPNRYEALLAKPGLLDHPAQDPAVTGARLVRDAFGLDIKRQMLEGPVRTMKLR